MPLLKYLCTYKNEIHSKYERLPTYMWFHIKTKVGIYSETGLRSVYEYIYQTSMPILLYTAKRYANI